MKLGTKLTSTQFCVSLILILIACLIFLTGLYYLLNIQYQRPKNLFTNGPVTTLPKTLRLNLDQPDDNSLTFQSSIIISGQTAPSANVLISTAADDAVIKSNSDGSFSTVLNLDEGINHLTTVVFDSTGDLRSAERTIYFSKEKI